jgi:hypothetical protein
MSTIIDRCNEIIEEQQYLISIHESVKENSQYPVNHKFEDWKDRCDVDKAFREWIDGSPSKVFTPLHMKSFAVFFAERVKGGKL